MKPRLLCLLVLVVAVLVLPGFAGKFSGWSGPFKVDIRIPEPPVAYIGKKSVKVSVTNAPADITGDQMRSLIEQALAPDIVATDSTPEALFNVNVISFEPPVTKQYTLSETFQVKVADRPVYNKDGTQKTFLGVPVTEPVYEQRTLPVQYWEGNARLAMSVDVQSATGARLDAFNPQALYNEKIKLSVGNQSTPEAGQVPDRREMVHRLSNQIAGQIRRRYITTDRLDVVLLAIDDELKAGNAMARAGKWDDALNQWESVKMKKNASDRIFNMAVAYEMLAYGKYRNGGDMQAAFPLFTKAMDLYAQALQADPTEKYIQQAQARITRAKTSMEAAMKQYQAQSFEAGKVAQEIAARQKQETEINSLMEQGSKGDLPTPDSATDGKFRIYAREHLRNETGDPAPEKIQAMLVAGKDLYGIEEDQGKRIVYQEIGRKRTHDKGVGLYRENLAEFAKDKRLDADQRAILSDISRQYGLSQQETSTLEQEAGLSSPAPKPNSLAPTTKPSTPTTKRKNTHPATAPKSAQSN